MLFRSRVGEFVGGNPELPIAHYAAHRTACLDKAIAEVVAQFGISGPEADAAIASRIAAVTVDHLLATAEARPILTQQWFL